jgi:predicted nucleic acid-binding protein
LGKIIKVSKLNEAELKESKYRLYRRISFIDEGLIPKETWFFAESIVKSIDVDDIDFIAINEFLEGFLWTGDKVLYNGVKRKGYQRVYNTYEMGQIKDKNQKLI